MKIQMKIVKLYVLSLIVLYSFQSIGIQCGEFLKGGPPAFAGRLISLPVADFRQDLHSLHGGVHYTEALPKSYGFPQIGVIYEDVKLGIMIEDYISGHQRSSSETLKASGKIVEHFGEKVLLIDRVFTSRMYSEEKEDGSVIEFRPRSRDK